MIFLDRVLWLIAGVANTFWLAFRVMWSIVMVGLAEAVIVRQIFYGAEILLLIISITLLLGMLILTINMLGSWTWLCLKKEWKQIWQWDVA